MRSCCYVQGRLIEARHIFQHLRGREDVSDELGLVIENMEVGPSPLEEWLIKPEDVKPSGLATPMTPGSGTTKSLGVSIPLVDEEVAAIQALEEARARAAFLAIAEGRELSYRAPLEAVLEDIEKGVAAAQHTEAASVPATPIFEQTTILSVDWSAVQGSPHGTPRQGTPRRQSGAKQISACRPIPVVATLSRRADVGWNAGVERGVTTETLARRVIKFLSQSRLFPDVIAAQFVNSKRNRPFQIKNDRPQRLKTWQHQLLRCSSETSADA